MKNRLFSLLSSSVGFPGRLLGGVLLFFGACACDQTGQGSGKSEGVRGEPVLVLQPAPAFNADSAYAFIAKQVSFGYRIPNTEAHRRCGDYLIGQLNQYGWTTYSQAFEVAAYNGTILKSRNIIGALNPGAPKRIILAAHWDTRPVADQEKEASQQMAPIAGANDGGSGVGVLLEVARTMAADSAKLGFGIDIIFFDSEDHGQPEFDRGPARPDSWCLGAKHWAANKHVPGYKGYYGILLDMVGAAGARFYQEGVSLEYAPSIVQKVWTIGHKLGYGEFFVMEGTPGIIDDHRYINEIAGIPMIDIIQYHPRTGFGDFWHTHNDNMGIISKETLKAVGQTLMQTLYNEVAPAVPGPAQ